MLRRWLDRISREPLTVFVHVPKTGGSTVNRILRESLGEGRDHCEGFWSDPKQVGDAARACRWLSGHLPRDEMEAALVGVSGRRLEFFTVLREPAAQVASQYNWLMEIQFRGEAFFKSHPPEIQAMSREIGASRNEDVSVVIGNLRRHRPLFLNQQSRLVLGSGGDGVTSESEIRERLRAYRSIGTEHTLLGLAGQMIGEKVSVVPQENTSPYHFDPAVFETSAMREFLAVEHAADLSLYATARGLERSA